jgi:AAA domain, putative AbiEii toxin, Type IV TA system
MSPIAYRARALGPLRAIDWAIPAGVSVVVGPNRVGKSTLLRLPELIGNTLAIGLQEAFGSVFEGVPHVRNLSVPPSTPMTLGLAVERWDWEVELAMRGGHLVELPSERLSLDGDPVLWRTLGSNDIEGPGLRFALPTGLMPSLAVAIVRGLGERQEAGNLDRDDIPQPGDPDVMRALQTQLPPNVPELVVEASMVMMAMLARTVDVHSFRTYHYGVDHLLRDGSASSSALVLESTGENLFSVLRNWRDDPLLAERYEFVVTTMREIFPYLGRAGFEEADSVVTMMVSDRRWLGDASIPISRESTGFLTALLQLSAVASCDHGGLVTLDEVETSLHPRAIRVLVEACRRRAAAHELRVVLATQSETVLDQFRDEPSQVFVFEPQQETSPKALTELFSVEYLSQFSLGDLFAHLEFGGDFGEEASP